MKTRSHRVSFFGPIGVAMMGIAVVALIAPTAEALPSPGKYKGKTGLDGNNGRISFRISGNRRKVSKIFVSAFVLCLRQNIFVPVAIKVPKSARLKGGKKFSVSGLDSEGNRYKVSGRAKGSRKFRGTAEVSTFSTFFNPITFTLDGEACAGSRSWKAKK